jgi:hypothetical protein
VQISPIYEIILEHLRKPFKSFSNQFEVKLFASESDIILCDDPYPAVVSFKSYAALLFNVSLMNLIGNNPTTIITHEIITTGLILAFVTAPTMKGVMKLPN